MFSLKGLLYGSGCIINPFAKTCEHLLRMRGRRSLLNSKIIFSHTPNLRLKMADKSTH